MKLIDFGFAQKSSKNKKELKDFVGTPYYIAPEIITEEPYGSACDIWSLGVLVYFIVAGKYPFEGRNMKELFANICGAKLSFSEDVWKYISQECKDFIRDCFTVDQSKRPSAA